MKTTSKKPNVILIVADDMGYGDFGIFSEGRVNTPNIDRLVVEGVCMNQHYSGSPICSPARASLLTGRYPHRTGAITQHELLGLDRIALREATLANMFQSANYKTGLIGKWHNGALDKRYEPNARGFDEFAGFCGGWSDYFKWNMSKNGVMHKSNGNYLTDELTQMASEFIDRNKNQSFFLMLAYSAPHSPFQAHKEIIDKYIGKGFDRITSITYAMIEIMDAGIGKILEKLDNLKIDKDTIVMFTSDNGPAFFNPPFMLEAGESNFNERFNAGLKGSKGWVYEGGIRVPMVIRYPAELKQNVINQELSHFTDWLPTLASICGIEKINDLPLDGYNIIDQLRGDKLKKPPRRFWQWNFYYPSIATNAAIRDGKWKLVQPMISGTRYYNNKDLHVAKEDTLRTAALIEADIRHKEDPTLIDSILEVPHIKYPPPEAPELYNIDKDPEESFNVAEQNPVIVSKLINELYKWFEEVEFSRKSIDDPLHNN